MTGRPPLRRRLAALGAAMTLLGLVVLAAGALFGGDEPGSVPEGGSQFGADRPADAPRGGTLLDALAGVLSAQGADESAEARAARERAGLPLSLSRAAAQVFAVGFEGTSIHSPFLRRLPARDWGAVLVGPDNYAGRESFRGLVRGIDTVARAARHLPPLIVAEHVADPVVTVPGIGPRSQSALAAEGTPAEARRSARRAGASLRRFGVDAVLAPVADLEVPSGPADGRAFGDDPERAAAFVRQAVEGWKEAGIVPIPGRFPGEGGASQDPLEGPATVGSSLEELLARDLRPFAAVADRAPAIETSAALYAAWDGVTPAAVLPDVHRLLRRRLGFDGVVVAGDLTAVATATGGTVGDAAVEALRAGADLLLLPGDRAEQDSAFRTVLAAVRRGTLPAERLGEAVRRVIALKRRYGVVPNPRRAPRPPGPALP